MAPGVLTRLAAAEKHLHAKDPGSFQGTPGFFLSFCCKMSALSWQNAENAARRLPPPYAQLSLSVHR